MGFITIPWGTYNQKHIWVLDFTLFCEKLSVLKKSEWLVNEYCQNHTENSGQAITDNILFYFYCSLFILVMIKQLTMFLF